MRQEQISTGVSSNRTVPPPDFFVDGGTLRPDAPSYVKRPADEALFAAVQAGRFCYVLTSRQMGKSSLMVRTNQRLKANNVCTAIVDLTQLGTGVSAEQWYLSLLTNLSNWLGLQTDHIKWWQEHNTLTMVQRFTSFLRDVVLAEIGEPVVIFIDEIDYTLNLDFSDDFFAAIRSTYNARASDPIFERLTFVLLGVATPSDLIADRTRTPFNIGQRIDLREFSRSDARVLQEGLQNTYPDHGELIFDRIFYWTNGHPYLTQKLCHAAVEENRPSWQAPDVDRLVETRFFAEEARKETNLQFVRDRITTNPRQGQLLKTYRSIHQDKEVVHDEQSLIQNQLMLYGLVQEQKKRLVVRNRIYKRVFNEDWIKETMPVDWTRRIAIWAVVALVVVSISFFIFLRQQDQLAVDAQAQLAIDDFNSNPNAAVLLNSLNTLFNLPGYGPVGRELFSGLTSESQAALFTTELSGVDDQRRTVIQGTFITFDKTAGFNTLLALMAASLDSSEEAESRILVNEIEQWLDGRSAYAEEQFTQAATAFSIAIGLNGTNPAVYFDRALAFAAQGEYPAALDDFNTIFSLNLDEDVLAAWRARVAAAIVAYPPLQETWWRQRSDYPLLSDFVPTPTSTPEPSDTPQPTQTPAAAPSTSVTTEPIPGFPTVESLPENTATATPTVTPTETAVPPTNTRPAPTETAVPPTNTSLPPPTSAPPPPTATSPPTATPTMQPTSTPPPTATPTETRITPTLP